MVLYTNQTLCFVWVQMSVVKHTVGIIKYVATDNSKQLYIIYELCENIGFSHKFFSAYEISLGLITNVRIVWVNFDKLFVTRNINCIADGSKLITMCKQTLEFWLMGQFWSES